MILKTHKTEHETTKIHIHNLNNPDNPKLTYKQRREKKPQDKQSDKIDDRIRLLQQRIKDLNDNFPLYAEQPWLIKQKIIPWLIFNLLHSKLPYRQRYKKLQLRIWNTHENTND